MQKTFLTKMAIVSIFFLVIVMFIIAGVSFLEVKGKVAVVQAADEENEGVDNNRSADSKTPPYSGPYTWFDNYWTWPSSTTPKNPDDKRYWLYLLAKGGNYPQYHYEMDINGDGLIDMAYIHIDAYYDTEKYGIFLNNGSNGMEPAYFCYNTRERIGEEYMDIWYGDCADVK